MPPTSVSLVAAESRIAGDAEGSKYSEGRVVSFELLLLESDGVDTVSSLLLKNSCDKTERSSGTIRIVVFFDDGIIVFGCKGDNVVVENPTTWQLPLIARHTRNPMKKWRFFLDIFLLRYDPLFHLNCQVFILAPLF